MHGLDPQQPFTVVACNSSDVAVCAYNVQEADRLFVQAKFSTQQSELSSENRDLLAVLTALQHKVEALAHSDAAA